MLRILFILGAISLLLNSAWGNFPVLQVLDSNPNTTTRTVKHNVPSKKHATNIHDLVENHVQVQLGDLTTVERLQYRDDSILRGQDLHVVGQVNNRGVSILNIHDQFGNVIEVRATVKQNRIVYIPVRSFERGEAVTRSDFYTEIADARFNRQALEIDQISFEDHVVAARNLTPGNPVRIGDLRREHLVKRGDMVKVVYRQGGVNISMSAIAQTNGYRGETITFKNSNTGKMLSARLMQSDYAEFNF